MKVVLDGVFNHASRGFFQFHDILENGQDSAYLDWFTVHGWPMNAYDHEQAPGYKAWWGLHALPKFNTDTPAVREFLWDVGRHWIDFGADGWRLDVAHEIDDRSFWAEFRRKVHSANPEAYIVGEVWEARPFDRLTDFDQEIDLPDEATRWLRGDCWDAVMNYLFTRLCFAYFIGEAIDHEEYARTSFHKIDPTGGAGVPPARREAADALSPEHDRRDDEPAGQPRPGPVPPLRPGGQVGPPPGHPLPDDLPRRPFDLLRRRDRHDRRPRPRQPPGLPLGSPRDLGHRPPPRLPEDGRPPEGAPRPPPRARSRSSTPREMLRAFLRQLGDESVVVAFNTGQQTERVDIPAIGSPRRRDGPRRGLDPRVVQGRGGSAPPGRAGPAVGAGLRDPVGPDERPDPAPRLATPRGGEPLALGSTPTRPGWRPRRTTISTAIPCSGPTPRPSTPGSSSPARWSTSAAGRAGIRSSSPARGSRSSRSTSRPPMLGQVAAEGRRGRAWRSTASRPTSAGSAASPTGRSLTPCRCSAPWG